VTYPSLTAERIEALVPVLVLVLVLVLALDLLLVARTKRQGADSVRGLEIGGTLSDGDGAGPSS
jgi:hypothetical protein